MNLILSIHKTWIEKILSRKKIYEFRNQLPLLLDNSSKLYLYETSKNGGRKMVVGEASVSKVIDLKTNRRKFGCYNFILDFAESECCFLNEKRKQTVTDNIRKVYSANITNVQNELLLSYVFFDDLLDDMIKNDSFSTFDEQNKDYENFIRSKNKAHRMMEECDRWLSGMGFYDDAGESIWNYAIGISDVKKYQNPIPLSDFKNRKGITIKQAPQSWCYTET